MIWDRRSFVTAAARVPRRKVPRRLQKAPVLSLGVWSLLAVVVLLAVVLASGIALVKGAHEQRSLHTALDQSQKKQNRLLAEYSRLLLERSTFAGLQTVEVVAIQELQMAFPDEIQEVAP